MADSIKDAWDEVGAGFADLGRRLSEHYKKVEPDRSASVDEEKVREALRLLTDQVDRAFTSLGATLRDPSAKEGLDRVVKSFGNALTTTFSEVGEEIRTRLKGGSEPPEAQGPAST